MGESLTVTKPIDFSMVTGWASLSDVFDSPSAEPGALTDLASGHKYSTGVSPSGRMSIRGALVFRHPNDCAFNSDWGIVRFSNGRVAGVEFSQD